MKLYDNDAYRDEFMELVYSLLHSDGTNDRANQIIDAFDSAMAVEAEPILPNDPLTLEELRKMDGEPVWIHSFSAVQRKTKIACWAIVETIGHANATFLRAGVNCRTTKWFTNYGQTWLAYRRKPEENT